MGIEAENICRPSILEVKYNLREAADHDIKMNVSPTSPSTPIFGEVRVSAELVSTEILCLESIVTCSETIKDSILDYLVNFVPNIRSGSYADIGPRGSMEDEHICIDDLAAHLGSLYKCPTRSGFYAICYGDGGPDAAAFINRNAMKLFFGDSGLPQTYDSDISFLKELENSCRRAFLLADLALANEQSVTSSCGTTAL